MTKGHDTGRENEPELSDAEMPGLCDDSDSDGECAQLLWSLLHENDSDDENQPDRNLLRRSEALDIGYPLAANHRIRSLLLLAAESRELIFVRRMLELGPTTEDSDLLGQIRDFLARHFGTRARDDVSLLNQISVYMLINQIT
jgi:hypothetical protein